MAGRACWSRSGRGSPKSLTRGPRPTGSIRSCDFVVLRVAESSIAGDGRIVFKLDISYERDAVEGWYPAAWTGMSLFSSGRIAMQFTAKVANYEINPKIPRADFQLDFPPGTIVADGRFGNSHYIVKPDGTKREISNGEMLAGIPFERLLATDTDEGMSRTRRVMRISAACATIVVIFTLFVWWLRRRGLVFHNRYVR